mgnify:CR=1 FL=1
MKNIIVLALAGIGDSILATPMIRNLRRIYPETKITALVIYPIVRDTFQRNKDIDEVIFFDFLKGGYLKSLMFVLKLRKRRFDLSFLAYPANRLRHNMISYLIEARTRIGHIYDIKRIRSLSFLHTKRIPIDENRHCIDENLKLLEAIGCDATKLDKKINFSITKEERSFAENFLKEHGILKKDLIIGVHAGSSELAGMALKRWPKEKFADVCDMLVERRKAKILLFGGENETRLKEEIIGMMRNKPISVDNINFFQSAALIEKCNGFLCNDTGLMHIASIFEIPTVVVTGHTNPKKTRPLHKLSKVITPKTVCSHYHIGEDLKCLYAGTKDYCLNQIGVEEVYDAIEEVIR